MKKFILFVFNGDPMCFIHVLLNVLDMTEKGYEARIVMEGASVKLLPDLVKSDNPLNPLWNKVKDQNLVDGVCRACSHKLGTMDSAGEQNLSLLDDMKGHPSMSGYIEDGFEIITF